MVPREVLTLILTPSRAVLIPLRDRVPAQRVANHAQRRLAHLYVYARSKTLIGLHPLVPFQKYNIPPAKQSKHKIEIWETVNKERRLVAANVSLATALEKYVKEGEALGPLYDLKETLGESQAQDWQYVKESKVAKQCKQYCLVKPGTTQSHISNRPGKKETGFVSWRDKERQPDGTYKKVVPLGALKEQHLNLNSPIVYWHQALDRMYQFLQRGNPVEVSLKIKSKHEPDKIKRLGAGNSQMWPWIHKYFPHMRPDFIMKAMPEGTYYMIEPFSDGKVMQWVMGPQLENYHRTYTDTLLHLKKQLEDSINKGLASRDLPTALKKKLKLERHKSYRRFDEKKDKRDRQEFLAERTEANKAQKKREREAEKLAWALKMRDKRARAARAAILKGEEPVRRRKMTFRRVKGADDERPSVVRKYMRPDYEREDERPDLVIKYIRSHNQGANS